MAKLEWDRIDERPFITGIDRGVFYVPNVQGIYDNGFAWNGLTAVRESFKEDKTRPHYFDGVKYLDSYTTGDYSAKLSAFTYPDEFMEFEGVGSLGNGLFADDQNPKVFGLSYRTLIGNASEESPQNYQIHLLYNITAVPEVITYQNGSNPVEPITFNWEIDSLPEKAEPYRPTAHIILDSRYLPSDMLTVFEDIIYGTSDENPRLPSLGTLIDIVLDWDSKIILPQPTTGLSELVAGVGDLTEINIQGLYYALPTTRLTETGIPGLYELETA